MNIKLFLFSSCIILCTSCSVMLKTRGKSPSQSEIVEKPQFTPEVKKSEDPPIVEVKEKLVEVKNNPVVSHTYFIIIGSFKNLSNAKKHQEQVTSDGFTSVLLQNEAGLYRVSVYSTDDISNARNEIRRIRTQFKQYEDTWLLISIK